MCQEIRDLIRKMSLANPFWGAPRIHGELLKLGIEVSQATVASARDGDGGSPDGRAISVAKSLRGAPSGLNPARVPGPYRDFQREVSAANSQILIR